MINLSDSNDVEIIGALNSDLQISVDHIVDVLKQKEQSLKHGEQFTGRPSTRIFVNDSYIVKLKFEYNFRVVEARRWISGTIEQERSYDVYHPAKTWFLILSDEGAIIANITPLLKPLHMLYEKSDSGALLDLLSRINDYYFRVAVEHEKRLDEGLSNFAIDDAGKLYYLDDDIYEWDDFTSFSVSVGLLILKSGQWGEREWMEYGGNVRAHILDGFKDTHWIAVVVEQVKDGFVANDQQQRFRRALFAGLQQKSANLKPGSGVSIAPSYEYKAEEITEDLIAVMADVHSNYPALEAVLEKLDELGVKNGIVLGDVVGYGPHPEECIKLLMETGFSVVKGNHDNAVATGSTSRGFSNFARWVVDWSREQLSVKEMYWLETLPPYIIHDDWLALHGAPADKTFFNAYVYRMTYEDNLDNLQERKIPVCFHGHSHLPAVYYRTRTGDELSTEQKLSLNNYRASLVCPGSVGKTRSQVPKAEFAVYNRKTHEIEFHRIFYKLSKTLDDMERFNFPEKLIERFLGGM